MVIFSCLFSILNKEFIGGFVIKKKSQKKEDTMVPKIEEEIEYKRAF